MAAPNRDDFSPKVKKALALRAGYFCSFEGCDRLTVGPSDESPLAVASVGVAAHIHAASPGGKRYLVSMTPDERSDIANAIWMCGVHGTLIDVDEVTYTADRLRAMKDAHESKIAKRVAGLDPRNTVATLHALGSSVVFLGEVIAANGASRRVRVDHFVVGDLKDITIMGEAPCDLSAYHLDVAEGAGRLLATAPKWTKENGTLHVEFSVDAPFARSSADELGTDLAIGDDGDLLLTDDRTDLATVGGAKALHQKVQLCVWYQKGGSPLNREFGNRIAELFHLYRLSPWLPQLIKMELIKMASIPYQDSFNKSRYTPFECVNRVLDVTLLSEAPAKDLLPVRIKLDVQGVGEWSGDFSLFLLKPDDS